MCSEDDVLAAERRPNNQIQKTGAQAVFYTEITARF
jgi:hypothetical protein